MKRAHLFTILAAAAVLAASCQKEPEAKSGNAVLPDGSIGFSAYTGTPTTKGTVVTAGDVQTDGIGVFAFYQKAVAEQPVPFNTHKFITPDFMYNQKVTYAASTGWTYEPLKYWPNNEGDRLSFFAYAPYNDKQRWDDLGISTSSNADRLSVSFEINGDASTQKDILWAKPGINQSNKLDGGVNNPSKIISFAFKHITSKVNIQLGVDNPSVAGGTADAWTANYKETTIKVKCIKFTGLSSNMTYSYPISDGVLGEPVVSSEGSYELKVRPYVENEGTATEKSNGNIYYKDATDFWAAGWHSFLNADNYLFLAPQKMSGSDAQVSITYSVVTKDAANSGNSSTISNTITKSLAQVLPDGELLSGKAYSLKFLIGLDDVNIAASVLDWDADIYDKEAYVPANYTVTMYQGENKYLGSDAIKSATFDDGDDIYVNVRDIDLKSTSTAVYRLKDYAPETTPYANLTEAMVARAGASNDIRLTEVADAIKPDFVTTKSITFDNATAVIDSTKIGKDSVYVFKYTDTPTGAVRYTIFKTGAEAAVKYAPKLKLNPAVDTAVNVCETIRYTVRENGQPVADLRKESFKIISKAAGTVEDVFDFSIEQDSIYCFTAKAADTTGVRKLIVSGDTVEINIRAYKFDKEVVEVPIGSTATVTLKLGNAAVTSASTSDFVLAGTSKVTITGVSAGVVTLSAETDATADNATLSYKKNNQILASCKISIITDLTGQKGLLNGHEYVLIKAKYDGTNDSYRKWATQNLAVTASGQAKWMSTSYQIGDYFQWAASYAGYGITADADKIPANLVIYTSFTNTCAGGGSDSFTFKDSKQFNNASAPYYDGSSSSYTKYNDDSKTVLDSSDDVANIVLGSTWRMPTGGGAGELKAMKAVTYWAWDATDMGYYVFKPGVGTSGSAGGRGTLGHNDDKTKSLLFFPAAGDGRDTLLYGAGSGGSYWSSTLGSDDTGYAYYLLFNSFYVGPEDDELRYRGFSVRPVSD